MFIYEQIRLCTNNMMQRDTSSRNLDWYAMGDLAKFIIDVFGWQQERRRTIIINRVITNLERRGYAL